MFLVIVLHDRVLKKDGKMENLPNFSGNWNFPCLVGRDTHTTASEAQHLIPEKRRI
jgi:hypothetical protein